MKKLLNFKTLTMVLLTATTLTATAATTDGVKTNTTTKVSKKIIDYSKMNYNQLFETFYKIDVYNIQHNNPAEITDITIKATDKRYQQLQRTVAKCLEKLMPLHKEVEKRIEKYKDNREVANMYRNLLVEIGSNIAYYKNEIAIYERRLKNEKMKEMY